MLLGWGLECHLPEAWVAVVFVSAEESAGAYLLARLDRDDALGALHWFTAALPPAGYEVVATATLSRPDETGASHGPEGVGASYEVEFRRGEDLTGNVVLTPLPAHAGDGARAVQVLVRTECPPRDGPRRRRGQAP